jgi:hypothetical protein
MNTNNITAYALNELHGEERESFESDLAADQSLQDELASSSRVADALAQVMTETGEGLEPQARKKLLQAIVLNQKAFQQRKKIVRLAVPISLAAAASIAVLLWVTGGMTTQGPAVAAADGQGGVEDKTDPQAAIVSRGLSGGFTAKISSGKAGFTFRGDGQLSDPAHPASFRINGIQTTHLAGSAGRTISMSESGRAALEMRADAGLSLTSPAVRMKPLIWDEDLTRWGSSGGQP